MFWKRRAERQQREDAVHDVDLVPGRLRATLRAGDLSVSAACPGGERGRLAVAAYVSQGLRSAKQAEVAFILRRPAGTRLRDMSADPFQAIRTLYGQTDGTETHFKEGDLIEVKTPAFGLPSFGLGFLPLVSDLSSLGVPPDTLLALILRPDECEAARYGGVHRVTAWLGQHYRQFPFPVWYDPERPSVVPSGLPDTVLRRVPLLHAAAEARALLTKDTLHLRLMPEAHERIGGALADRTPMAFALLTGFDSAADCRVVWTPVRAVTNMICPPDSTMSRRGVGFVLVVPDPQGNSLSEVEDGVAIVLRDEAWCTLRDGILAGNVVQIALADGRQVRVDWIDTDYFNPFDGQTYHVERGWQRSLPGVPSGEPEVVRAEEVRFLGPLPANVPVEPLVALFRATDAVVEQCLADSETAFSLLVQHELGDQGRAPTRLATDRAVDPQRLERLEELLEEALAGLARIETSGQTLLIHQRYWVLPPSVGEAG